MSFANGSEYELESNITIKEGEKAEWIDLSSAANCLGGWFKLPSGKESFLNQFGFLFLTFRNKVIINHK